MVPHQLLFGAMDLVDFGLHLELRRLYFGDWQASLRMDFVLVADS
jgi:hypothetical protein